MFSMKRFVLAALSWCPASVERRSSGLWERAFDAYRHSNTDRSYSAYRCNSPGWTDSEPAGGLWGTGQP